MSSDQTALPRTNPEAGAAKLLRLEALRGFAAVYVVFHHTLPREIMLGTIDIGALFRFGQEAVILFFLLSGFVIHYSFGRGADKSFSTYFWKRALRIYVPLLVALPLSWLFASWSAGGFIDPNPGRLFGNLAMLQDWAWAKPNVLVNIYMENGPLWSLSYEWWFYMLYWPVQRYLPLGARRNAIVLTGAVLAAALYALWPHFLPRLLMYFGIWWAGVMLADAYQSGQLRNPRTYLYPMAAVSAITLATGVPVLLDYLSSDIILFGRHPFLEFRHALFALISLGIAWGWHRARWFGFDALFKPFLWLAPISYAIYIMHWFLLAEADYLEFLGNPWLEYTAYTFVMLGVCYLIELRLYPWVRRRFVASRRARVLPSA